jgi:hypothetical protein
VAKVYIVSFRTHDDRRPSKFIVLADNMKSAIKMAWEHGGADFQSRFDKSTAQAEQMKEGRFAFYDRLESSCHWANSPVTISYLIELRHPRHPSYRDFSGNLRLSAPLTHICGKGCGGPSLARVFNVDFNSLKMVVVLALLVIVVWSLVALPLFSIWTEEGVEISEGIIWLSLGIIGFSAVLVLYSAYI